MIPAEERPSPYPARSLALAAVLAAATLALALFSGRPVVLGASIALAGVAVSEVLLLRAPRSRRALVPLPALVVLGFLAATVPLGPISELLAGLAGVVLLAWLAEDPHRPPRGALRGHLGWGLPALAVGLAWIGAFLLPPDAAPVGVAGALLAATIVVIAYLFRRPEAAVEPVTSTI